MDKILKQENLLSERKARTFTPGRLRDIRSSKSIFLDEESKVVFIILLLSQLLFPNGYYLFTGVLVIYIIFYKVQQPFKSGVFTVIALNHFVQIVAAIWQANSVGKEINFRSPHMSDATMASFLGLLVLFIPIIYFQHKLPDISFSRLKQDANKFSTAKSMNVYMAAFYITSLLSTVAFLFGGLTQVIFSLVKLKWLFFLLFGYQSLVKKEKRNIFYLFVILEFVSGFYSFFSEFKTVIYFLVVLLLGLLQVINIKRVIYGGIIGAALLIFALVWTQIKGDYRTYLNEGSKQQVAAASRQDALGKLYDLSNNVDEESLNSAQYRFLDRLQYTYHFAKTMETVPAIIPFQNGKNWMNDIEFATTPRILNPNKPTLDATEKTKQYTRLGYAGRASGASFSLGYFAECYIDFGFWGMIFPLLIIGIVYGLTYTYLMKNASRNFVFNYSVVGAFFLEFAAFEMDGTFLLGRFLATLVTFIFCIKFFFPWVINYISVPQTKKTG